MHLQGLLYRTKVPQYVLLHPQKLTMRTKCSKLLRMPVNQLWLVLSTFN